MDNLQIGNTLYVLASNKHSFYPVEIINIKKEYEKEAFPERYLTITTKADTLLPLKNLVYRSGFILSTA